MMSTWPQYTLQSYMRAALDGVTTIVGGLYLAAVLLCSYSETLSWLPQFVALVLFLLFIADYARRPMRAIRIPGPIALYGFWILLACATTMLGPTNAQAILTRATLLKVGAITCVFSVIVRTTQHIVRISIICICSFLIVVTLNRNDIGAIQDAVSAGIIADSYRLDGTMGNANVLGMSAVVVCWLAVLLIVTARTRFVKVLASAVVPPAVMVVFWTQSRKALLALPLSAGAAVVLLLAARPSQWPRQMWIRAHKSIVVGSTIFAILAVALIVYSPYGVRVRDLLSGNMDASASTREDLARTGLQLWSQHPIGGIGLEQFRNHYAGEYSHSTIIEVLVSTGLIGCVLYFGALIMAIQGALWLARNAVEEDVFRVAIVTTVVFLVFSFFNLFAVKYTDRLLWPLLGAFSGFVYGQGSGRDCQFLPDTPEM